MADPACIRRNAERFGWRAFFAMPWLSPAGRKIAQRQVHFQPRTFVGRGWAFEVYGKTFRKNARIDCLAIFAGSRANSRTVVDLERQFSDPKIVVWKNPVRFETQKELPDILICANCSKVVGSNVGFVSPVV